MLISEIKKSKIDKEQNINISDVISDHVKEIIKHDQYGLFEKKNSALIDNQLTELNKKIESLVKINTDLKSQIDTIQTQYNKLQTTNKTYIEKMKSVIK
jgi:hypothetical protein